MSPTNFGPCGRRRRAPILYTLNMRPKGFNKLDWSDEEDANVHDDADERIRVLRPQMSKGPRSEAELDDALKVENKSPLPREASPPQRPAVDGELEHHGDHNDELLNNSAELLSSAAINGNGSADLPRRSTATAAGGATSHSAEPSSRSGPAPAAEAQARTSAREDDVGEGRRMTRHRLKSSRKRSAAGPPE